VSSRASVDLDHRPAVVGDSEAGAGNHDQSAGLSQRWVASENGNEPATSLPGRQIDHRPSICSREPLVRPSPFDGSQPGGSRQCWPPPPLFGDDICRSSATLAGLAGRRRARRLLRPVAPRPRPPPPSPMGANRSIDRRSRSTHARANARLNLATCAGQPGQVGAQLINWPALQISPAGPLPAGRCLAARAAPGALVLTLLGPTSPPSGRNNSGR
jgi:hypothetical protein